MLHSIFKRLGYYGAKRQYMPVGIDWMWDLYRLIGDEPHTFLDVGANVGQSAIALHQMFPRARIHSFEPVPATYEKLALTTNSIPSVTTHQVAISDKSGTAEMMIGDNSLVNRIVTPDRPGLERNSTFQVVPTLSLSDFTVSKQITKIDLLKIDVEGAESAVLRGAKSLFQQGVIRTVFIEVGFSPNDATHTYITKVIEDLQQFGLSFYALYDLCKLRPPDYTSQGLVPTFGNALFVRDDSPSKLCNG